MTKTSNNLLLKRMLWVISKKKSINVYSWKLKFVKIAKHTPLNTEKRQIEKKINFPKKRRFATKKLRKKLLPKSWNKKFLIRRLVLRRRRRFKRRWRKVFLRKLKKKKIIDKLKPIKKIHKAYFKYLRKKTLTITKNLVCHYISGRRLVSFPTETVVVTAVNSMDARDRGCFYKTRNNFINKYAGLRNRYLLKKKKRWKRYLRRWRPRPKRRLRWWVRRKLRKRKRLKKLVFFKKIPKNLFYTNTTDGGKNVFFRTTAKKVRTKKRSRLLVDVTPNWPKIKKSKSQKNWIGAIRQKHNLSAYRPVENSIRHLIYENWNFWEKFHPEKDHPRYFEKTKIAAGVESGKQESWPSKLKKKYTKHHVFDWSKKKNKNFFIILKKKKPKIEQTMRLNLRYFALTKNLKKQTIRLSQFLESHGRGSTISTGALVLYLRFWLYYDHLNFMPGERSCRSSNSIYNSRLQSSWKKGTANWTRKAKFLTKSMPKVKRLKKISNRPTKKPVYRTSFFENQSKQAVRGLQSTGWRIQNILKTKKLLNNRNLKKEIKNKLGLFKRVRRVIKKNRKLNKKKIKKLRRRNYYLFLTFSELDEISYEDERCDIAEKVYEKLVKKRKRTISFFRWLVRVKQYRWVQHKVYTRIKRLLSPKRTFFSKNLKNNTKVRVNFNLRFCATQNWLKTVLLKKKSNSNYEYQMLLKKKQIPKFKVKIKFKNFRFRNKIFYKKKKVSTRLSLHLPTNKLLPGTGFIKKKNSSYYNAITNTGHGQFADNKFPYLVNLEKNFHIKDTGYSLPQIKTTVKKNELRLGNHKNKLSNPFKDFKIFKRRYRKKILFTGILSKKKKYKFVKIYKSVLRRITKLRKVAFRVRSTKNKSLRTSKRGVFLKKIFKIFLKKNHNKVLDLKKKFSNIKNIPKIKPQTTVYATNTILKGPIHTNRKPIQILRELLYNKTSIKIKKKKKSWLSPQIRAAGLQIKKNSIKGGFKNLNLKIVGRLGIRAALRGLSSEIYHIIGSLPLRIRRFFRKAKYAFTMMLLVSYHDVGVWSSYLNKLFYRTKFFRQRRLFYTLRYLLPRTAQICGDYSSILGMYMSFKGKIASRGGQRSKILRTSNGWYSSANFGIQYKYRFKQIWSKSGAIGLKTIITCGNMHINRD